jgi:nitrite reductase/ring-hydroxylating ferredoxin subunit
MLPSPEGRVALADVPPGRTAKVQLVCGGRAVDAFVVNHEGAVHAYVNRCPHVGAPLDLWPNEFLDEEGRTLVCATHGALFEPDTGRCIGGPCMGDALTRLPVRREGEVLVVSCPPA